MGCLRARVLFSNENYNFGADFRFSEIFFFFFYMCESHFVNIHNRYGTPAKDIFCNVQKKKKKITTCKLLLDHCVLVTLGSLKNQTAIHTGRSAL